MTAKLKLLKREHFAEKLTEYICYPLVKIILAELLFNKEQSLGDDQTQ